MNALTLLTSAGVSHCKEMSYLQNARRIHFIAKFASLNQYRFCLSMGEHCRPTLRLP